MSCREMNLLMSPYLDGQLDSVQTHRLEQHVATCTDCRYKMGLLKEIPQALQTDRMLAPRPEFTAIVMQQIVIRSQFQTQGGVQTSVRTEFRSETHISFRNTEATKPENSDPNPKNEAKIMLLPQRPAASLRPAKAPGAYVLRFSSMAAALVLAVAIGIYALQIAPDPSASTTASTSSAVSFFATTLTAAFQSPPELLLGFLVASALLVTLWFVFRSSDKNDQFSRNDLHRERDSK